MNVLKLCYEYPPVGGGGGKVAAGIVEHIVSAGHAVDLVTMSYDGSPVREQNGKLRFFRVPSGRRRIDHCYPHEMLLYVARALPLASSLARGNRYDLNHTHFVFPDGIVAYWLKKRTGLDYVITAHGSDVPGYNPDRFRLLHWLLRPLWRRIIEEAACIVCPSAYLRDLVRRQAPAARCELIPNGIDPERFTPRPARRKRMLVVSRLVERKGVQYFLDALADMDHDYDVCVVGDGPYLPRLKRIAHDLQLDVRFTGFMDNRTTEFRELLESSEIFVFTSAAENFPIVLLEAMTSGLSIVTADDTGCREVVGDAALTVPPRNADAIRDALTRLIHDAPLRRELGSAARQRIVTRFSEASVMERYDRVYAALADGPATDDPARAHEM